MQITDYDILRKMQSRVVSREEFNFDNMTARPLLSLLDYSDLDKLYNVASSIRYSGNIQKKLAAISDVMNPRGFRKLSQGTNRIAYSCYEDPSIVIKIATDKVGMKDNPAEFINQHKLKPFVTKIFEVTPDGVVAEVERVEPITSREEFLSSSAEIFDLLNMITQKYVMADIGSRYFMNFGVRHGFGAVLLDYPYMYEPDGGKLVCSAPNFNEPSGICGGWIDYDIGFNELVCTKCGATYKAIEIAKDIENNKIIRKGRKSKMKVAVNWNNKIKETSLDGQIVTNNDVFKASKPIVRASENPVNVGKLKVATPVVHEKKVVAVDVSEGKAEKVDQVEEPAKVEEETKTIADPTVALKTLEFLEEEMHTPQPSRNKVEDKKSSLKVKVTTQDGKTAEQAVGLKKDDDENYKESNIKVNDKPVRHYKPNKEAGMPRRSQVQLTAITLPQLKEIDFKYSSTDLEYHKMFFKGTNGSISPSVMIDYDSIPKDKLEIISGNEPVEDVDQVRKELSDALAKVASLTAELTEAKSELKNTTDALDNLRKIDNERHERISVLESTNIELQNKISELTEENNKLVNESTQLMSQIEDKNNHISELEANLQVFTDPHLSEVEAPMEEEYDDTAVDFNADNEEEDEEYVGEFDTDDLAFISGNIQTLDRLCEIIDVPVPERAPSNAVITFRNGSEDETEFLRDQCGRVICLSWLNDYCLDELSINRESPVVMGEGENDTVEE